MAAAHPSLFSKPRWRWLGVPVVTTLAGLVLAAIGPFGTYVNHGLALRCVYWVGAVWLGTLLYNAVFRLVGRFVAPGTPRGWLALIAAALVASVPEALVTRGFAFALWPDLAARGLGVLLWYGQTSLIGLLAALCTGLLWQSRLSRAEAGTPVVAPPVQPFAGEILALQMEDHYVRVHRLHGSQLVLMPLAQAIKGVAETEGLRTHRSWWVARRAVAAVEGTPRSMRLRLCNGVMAPVARASVARLRAAGWIVP